MYHKQKSGFLLIESMLHAVLLALLSLLVCSYLYAWQRHITQAHRLLSDALPIYLAMDIVRADVARTDPAEITIKDTTLHLAQSDKRLLWSVREERLMRSSSSYDLQKGRWRKAVSSVLAEHIAQPTFKLLKHGVSVKLNNKERVKSVTTVAGLRNGIII